MRQVSFIKKEGKLLIHGKNLFSLIVTNGYLENKLNESKAKIQIQNYKSGVQCGLEKSLFWKFNQVGKVIDMQENLDFVNEHKIS